MSAAIGTIPYFSTYQPGALPIASTVYLEIVDSLSATSALSYNMSQQDLVGKAPAIIPNANPVASDRFAFFQVSSGLPKACTLGNFGIPFGNVPTGGTVGQILVKNTAVNYDASWTTTISTTFGVIGTTIMTGMVGVLGAVPASTSGAMFSVYPPNSTNGPSYPARVLEVRDGNETTDIITTHGTPTVVISRCEAITDISLTDGADGPALSVYNTGRGSQQAVGATIVGHALAACTSDVVGVYGVGTMKGTTGLKTAFGGFFIAEAYTPGSGAVGIQLQCSNLGGTNYTYAPAMFANGTTPYMVGLDVTYYGGGSGAVGPVGTLFRATDGKVDVGFGFLNGVKSADIRTDTTSTTILYAGPTGHVDGIDLSNATFSGSPFKSLGFSVSSSGALNSLGTARVTGSFGIVGTTLITGTFGVVGTTNMTGALFITGGSINLPDDLNNGALKIGTLGHLIGRTTSDGSMLIGGGQANIVFNALNPIVINGTATIVGVDGGTTGPVLGIYHSSPSPAGLDRVGRVRFFGNNSAAAKTAYGEIGAELLSTTAGAEYGCIVGSAMSSGVLSDTLLGAETFLLGYQNPASNNFEYVWRAPSGKIAYMYLESFDPGAIGPSYNIWHNSASQAAADIPGAFVVDGNAANGTTYINYSRVDTIISNASTTGAGAAMVFKTVGSAVMSETMRIDDRNNLVIGTAAIASAATNGFLYLPTTNGTPTGTPTTYAGRVAHVYDTTNNKLWFYNGSWKAAVFA